MVKGVAIFLNVVFLKVETFRSHTPICYHADNQHYVKVLLRSLSGVGDAAMFDWLPGNAAA